MAAKEALSQRVADSLTSQVKELGPRVAESLVLGGIKGYTQISEKDFDELVSRRWADPEFRATLLESIGDDRFLATAKRLGYISDDLTPEEELAQMSVKPY